MCLVCRVHFICHSKLVKSLHAVKMLSKMFSDFWCGIIADLSPHSLFLQPLLLPTTHLLLRSFHTFTVCESTLVDVCVWILVLLNFVRRWTQTVHIECVIKHLVWYEVFRIVIYVFCHSLFKPSHSSSRSCLFSLFHPSHCL